MQAAGAEAMPADAGRSAQNALDYAIQSSGSAGRQASEAISGRVSRDAQAITQALDQALGTPQGVQTTRAQIAADSAGARRAGYDAAYDAPIDYSSQAGMRLEELLGRLDRSEIEAANTLMRKEGHQSRQILAEIADDGTVTYLRQPDVRQIDYITRALRDKAEANAGLGRLGGQTNEGRIYGNLAGDMRSATREAVPEYGAALDTAADPIRRSQAVEFGAELLRPGTTRETVASRVADMTQPELNAVAQGVRSAFDDTLANVTRAVSDGDMQAREAIKALRDLSSRAAREKLAMVVGEQRATTLFDELDRATRSFELRANVADNSKTFQRQEMARRQDAFASPDDPFSTVARGEPLNAAKRGVQALSGQTKGHALRLKDAINEDVVGFLTARGPDAYRRMNALSGFNARTGQQNFRALTAQRILDNLGPNAAYQSARLEEAMRQ
jgi:hypothetical protein